MDVNDLKITNDLLGHPEGDKILKVAGHIIYEAYGKIGKVYRIGGDEFCILCKNQEYSSILQANQRLLNSIEVYNKQQSKHMIPLSIAYGHITYSKHLQYTIYEAFTLADRKMYQCKEQLKLDAMVASSKE